MTDSVPAPMVPTTEGSVILAGWGEGTHPCHWMHNGNSWIAFDGAVKRVSDLTIVRVLFDAATPATPAASVPAADILALAEKWQDGGRDRAPVRFFVADLRALAAAAEQADKGEGGQRGGKSQDTATPHEPSLTAPAAPPEPLCRCGHAKSEHAQESFSCGHVIEGSGCELHVCSCSVFRYGSPARVPVNDEAESAQDSLSMRTLQRMRKERDEALARVAVLEKQVAFDVRIRLEVESVLDEALGIEPVFGAGNGLASDVRLLMAQRDAALAARQEDA